jgi:oligoendopeptidase F
MMSRETRVSPVAVWAGLTLCMVILMTTSTATQQNQDRSQLQQVEWDLSEIYSSYEAWNTAKAELADRVAGLAGYRGRLGESAETLKQALDSISETEKELARLYVFAFLKADEDRRVAASQERRGLAAALLSTFGETVAFVSPELLRVGAETVERYLAEEPGLARHAFNIRNILRQEPHTLSDEAEQVIAAIGPVVQGPERVYAMLTSSDMPFPTVTLSTGEEVQLDQAAYSLHRASRNRNDRKQVFDRFWGAWKSYETTLGQTLDTHVKGHVFQAKTPLWQCARRGALWAEYPDRGVSHADRGGAPPPALLASLFPTAATHARSRRPALLRHLPSVGRIGTHLWRRRIKVADTGFGGAAGIPLPGVARGGVRW